MWKKIKLVFISIGILALVILSFIFGSRANGRGVSDADGLNRDINDGIDGIQGGIGDVAGQLDGVSSDIGQGAAQVGNLAGRIGHTQGKLQNALEILRAAKARANAD